MRNLRYIKVFPVVLFCLWLANSSLFAQGHIEFGFHYGQWSLNILKNVAEEGLADALETNLKDKIMEEINEDFPWLQETQYSQEVSFDSEGNNYGFEIRWYPGGQSGSFSLGLSVEKTTMRVTLPKVEVSMILEDMVTSKTASFQGNANGARFEMDPLSFHLSFRWDIKPSWKLHPYITFGFGAATGSELEEAEYSVTYSGDLDIEGEESEHYEDSRNQTLKELEEELEEEGEDFFLPDFIPFIQLNLGLKGQLTENLFLLVDAGIWDGFLLRGGVAFRF